MCFYFLQLNTRWSPVRLSIVRSIDMQIMLEINKQPWAERNNFPTRCGKTPWKINRLTASHIWHYIEMCVIFFDTQLLQWRLPFVAHSILFSLFFISNFLNLFSLFPVCVYSDYNREIWSCYFLFIVHLKNRVATSPPRDPEKVYEVYVLKIRCVYMRFLASQQAKRPNTRKSIDSAR